MSKALSKAEVRAMAEEAAKFGALWDEAHAMNAALQPPVEAVAPSAWVAATTIAPAMPVVPVAPEQGTQRYKLNAPAAALAAQGHNAAPTLQKKGDPKHANPDWRAAGHKGTNTRAIALATINMNLSAPFTAAEAQKLLTVCHKDGGLHLGSGTPASYVKAFIKNGYFMPVDAE